MELRTANRNNSEDHTTFVHFSDIFYFINLAINGKRCKCSLKIILYYIELIIIDAI